VVTTPSRRSVRKSTSKKFYYLCAMAKKKMTRDYPLPSSDGMFGGPGDPKKKYTASDSANYMGTYNRFKKDAKIIKDYFRRVKKDGNPGVGRMDTPVNVRDRMFRRIDTLNQNPFDKTFMSRRNKNN